MVQSKKYNLLFVVAHPDDESYWVGGLLSQLTILPFLRIYIICLSGNDNNSPRVKEFKKVINKLKGTKAILLGGPLRKASKPLPSISKTITEGIKILKIEKIDLLITHSPHGDEHRNPHHVQAFQELYEWTKFKKIPFGFFSTIPLPAYSLNPILGNMPIINKLQIVTLALCKSIKSSSLKTPKYFIQFLNLTSDKQKLLKTYKSINLKKADEGYVSFKSNCECIYIYTDRGFEPFKVLLRNAKVPGSKYLFSYFKNTVYNIYTQMKG